MSRSVINHVDNSTCTYDTCLYGWKCYYVWIRKVRCLNVFVSLLLQIVYVVVSWHKGMSRVKISRFFVARTPNTSSWTVLFLINKANLVLNFSKCVYFFPLHVSGDYVRIVRFIPPCIPDSHPYRVTSTKCRINTVVSPFDGHIVARNM